MNQTVVSKKAGWRALPRNVWAVSLTSFFMDISSEMVLNLLPLFLSNVLGVGTSVVGLIEGIGEATASLLKAFSGWLSDRLRARKWLAVAGYGLSALSKPFFYFANAWTTVLAVRWADRVGKGVRTAPRDALVADSIGQEQRGLAFGLHRAADTGGAVLGLLIALGVVWALQPPPANLESHTPTASPTVQETANLQPTPTNLESHTPEPGGITKQPQRSQPSLVKLERHTFQVIVLVSLVPAVLAVLSLALGAQDVPVVPRHERPVITLRGLGKPFLVFMVIVGLFDLGNSSDAFLVLRAQERGLNVLGVLGMLITFNLVYTLVSTPAGSLSDRIGRRQVIIGGWLAYAAIYFGFAMAGTGWHVWMLYALYGVYYGLAYGAAKAMVADLVPVELRGIAYGTYNAVLGLLDFPASFIAGVLWQGVGKWPGFGPSAPFFFGAALALTAAILFFLWKPPQLEKGKADLG